MARKKKTKTKITNESSVESKSTLLTYSGKVTIKKMFGNKVYKEFKVKNNGTQEFFRLILLSIGGQNMSASMPRFIHTFNSTASGDTSTCVTNIPATDINLMIDNNNNYELVFTFLIPFSQLAIGSTTNKIKLYNVANYSADDLVLAEFNLADENNLEADGVTNYLITWTMSVANA